MSGRTKKVGISLDRILEIYNSLVELTERQKEIILGLDTPDSIMAGKLERYVKAKAELIKRLDAEEKKLSPVEAETLAERKVAAMGRLQKMETENIKTLGEKINALGVNLLGINYSKRLKSTYAVAKSTPQPRFFDKKDV